MGVIILFFIVLVSLFVAESFAAGGVSGLWQRIETRGERVRHAEKIFPLTLTVLPGFGGIALLFFGKKLRAKRRGSDTEKQKLIKSIKTAVPLVLLFLFLWLLQRATELAEVHSKSFAVLIVLIFGFSVPAFVTSLNEEAKGLADIFALLFSATVIYFVISVVSIGRFYLTASEINPHLSPKTHIYGFLTVLIPYFAIYALIGNAKAAVLSGNILFTVFALLNNLCYTYRERPLTFADLGAWKETLSIAGEGYSSGFGENAYCGIALMVVASLIIILVIADRNLGEERKEEGGRLFGKRAFSKSQIISRVLCLIAAILLGTTMYAGEFLKERGVNELFFYVSPLIESPVLDFCCSAKNLRIKRPENYTPEALLAKSKPAHKQSTRMLSASMKPNIIVILSESYSDMRNLLPFETNIDPYSFFDEFKEKSRWGRLYVSTIGGATANVEFELLTGCNTAFFPPGTIPYNWYIKSEFPSMFSTLKAQGYSTLTIHPYTYDFWNRKEVYAYYGVEESYWDKDFINPETIRNLISDKENYKFLIESFEEKEPGKPIFIFNITMQNHGPYTLDLPSTVKITSEESYPELEQYLNLINITGRETEKLIKYFKTVKEPTIIVFFGDHLPAIDKNFYVNHNKLWEKEPEMSSRRVEMQSDKFASEYYIWANFDFESGRAEDISINYLQGEILDFAGLKAPPLIDYQHETLRKKWPVIVSSGCKSADGRWVYFNTPEFKDDDDVREYYALHYNLISDIKQRREELFYVE